MKILTAKQIQLGDRETIRKEPISSIDLMERASLALFTHIKHTGLIKYDSINLFCGVGNNGGDGLVLARMFIENGLNVTVYIVHFRDSYSPDFTINLNRLKQMNCKLVPLYEETPHPTIPNNTTVIDAIFGTGLNRRPNHWVEALVHWINKTSSQTISIDIPSGLFTDKPSEHQVVKADHTLTFQVPKMVCFLESTAKLIGEWTILDIGIDKTFLNEVDSKSTYITSSIIEEIYRPKSKFSHKGTNGHGLIIGGEYGKIGAVQLAAKACLSSGAGLVRVYTPECGYIPIQTAIPELMVITDNHPKIITNIPNEIPASAIGIGIGMGQHTDTLLAFEDFLNQNTKPLVIDADGINMLAKESRLLSLIPPKTVITPHPKELQRLIGAWSNDFERIEKTKKFSEKYNIIIVVKGAHTQIIYKDSIFINSTGNQGMATAGSGDVLTGMVTGLLAQQYYPLEAAILGVYLHGFSGDKAFKIHENYHTITASSIIEYLPRAFKELRKNERS